LWQQQWRAQALEKERQRQTADVAVSQAMAEARLLLEQAQAAPLLDRGRFREALTAARKAEELARTAAASDEVRQQAAALADVVAGEEEAARRDRQLLAALLEVRGPREGPNYQTNEKGVMKLLPEPSADEQFAIAFRTWGLDVETTPTTEAAARLR